MTEPSPSPKTFRLIQVGTAAGLLVVFGSAFAWIAAKHGSDAYASLFIGGAITLVGIALATTSAARIYDPSRSVTLDRYEGHEEHVRVEHGPDGLRHEPRVAYVERRVGEDEVTMTRAGAKKLTIRGVVVGAAGVAIAYALLGI